MMFTRKDIQNCAMCGKGIMHAGIPLFYQVTVARLGLDLRAVQQHSALEQMMGGNTVLADVLSPVGKIAEVLQEPRTIIVCEMCTHEHPALMNVLLADEARDD